MHQLWRESESFLLPDFFTRDGRRLVFEQTDERGVIDLWIGELDRPDTARKLFDDPGAKYVSSLSRDGVWIAYCSDATRSLEVYVRRLDGAGAAHQVSSGGGCQPQWRGDARELFYVRRERRTDGGHRRAHPGAALRHAAAPVVNLFYNAIMPTRFRSRKIEAVVLRHQDWGEADRLLWLYSREMGKIRAVAKRIRKVRSRKAGRLEPFTRVNLLLAEGRDILLITQAEASDHFPTLRSDLVRIGYASYVIELLDRFTYEEGENAGLYQLLADSLARLDSPPDPAFAVHYYEIRLLDLVGFRPQLFHCVLR